MADTNQSMSAASRVFATPELLEAILLEMWKTRVGLTRWQAKDVLLSQRVSKAFQSCILGSPEIQRRLGFKPDIIQLPGPVENERGDFGQSHLLWANGDLIPALKGQPRVFFRKNARKISVEVPYPTLSFERSLSLHIFEAALKDDPASFLKMYPQRLAPECIVRR